MNKNKLQALNENEVVFEIIIHHEEVPIEGNEIACKDFDSMTQELVRKQLESGNKWAWFKAEVKAKWNNFEASVFLGLCSYKDEEEFKGSWALKDLKKIAFEDLNARVERLLSAMEIINKYEGNEK